MRLYLVCLLATAIQVSQGSANSIITPSYSCFTGFQAEVTDGCKSRIQADDGSIVQEALSDVENSDFCVSGPTYGAAKQGNFGKAKNYIVSADLKMIDMGKYSSSYGFLGIAFNMIDSKNYDIAYVRPHATSHCWELGYVEGGLLFGRDFGLCTETVRNEFNLAIKIEGGKGELYVNDGKEAEFTPFFPPVNKAATAMRNNMIAKMTVNNLQVCQEISCVSRNDQGKTVVTKPLESYQDGSMSKCEACTCGLYGQIRCGCRTAAEQGISCSSSTIPAVGHDCCARCVPPSSSCAASGDPHYNSFDGRSFDFQGTCTYCLAKTNDWEIRNKNRGGPTVAYVEYCQLLFDGDQYELRSSLLYTPQGEAERRVATPFKKYYNSEDYVYCVSPNNCAIHIKQQKMVNLQCQSGYFNIWIHGTYYERTECICGTWDGNPNNDFVTRDGKVTGSPTEAGNSWRVSNDDGCPDPPEPEEPCDAATREVRNMAEQNCARFKSEPFRSCPLDVTPYYKNCMFDLCTFPAETENLCENAEAYVDACREKSGHIVEGWRSNTFCPKECKESFVYQSCGRGCYPTCMSPEPEDCSEECIEGCYCPKGTLLQDGECVDVNDCQCLHEGAFFDNGQSWNDTAKCETCTCGDAGIVECDPVACSRCPEGQVPVSAVGSCCPYCLSEWADENQDVIEVKETEGPAELECVLHEDVLVSPDDITWRYKSGEEITLESKPDNFVFSEDMLTLTINPAQMVNENDYVCEIVFNGVVGECRFDMNVIPKPTTNLIDLDGDSPRVVKEGDCQTMSVQVVGDVELEASDFTWTRGVDNRAVDFSEKRITKQDGGKTIKICDAEDADEGAYHCCVTKDDVTDCVDVELQVLAVCDTDDKEYVEEETWMVGDYESCLCGTDGEVECQCVEQEAVECDPETEEETYEDDCKLSCTRLPATCIVTGDPHYKSFDGFRHDFQGGNCRFTLVKTKDFEVIGTNKHRNDNEDVSWNDAVDIVYQTVNINLGQEGAVTVNGKDVFLPYNKQYRNKQSVSIIKAGSNVIVKLLSSMKQESLSLIWDGNSTVSSSIHGTYFEGTAGLCGSWDDDVDNDQDDKDVAEFGWSFKYNDEVCEEEPQPAHPCDEALFPSAAPIADSACDALLSAPFTTCHELVDVEAALHNCKYDVCSCYDASCACSAYETYVKECIEAGVTSLGDWRDVASFCPLTCDEGLTYDACGSYCPATCGIKDPDCGKMAGKCNEGCFCPKNQYLQGGECVDAAECKCEFNGTFQDVGSVWHDANMCQDCGCRAEGEVSCTKTICKKCKKSEQRVYETEDSCCADCVEDWLWATEEEVTLTVGDDMALSCECVVNPKSVDWLYSGDAGENWEEFDGARKLTFSRDSVTADQSGLYKCVARKNYRTKSAIITVTIEEAPADRVLRKRSWSPRY